MSDVGVDIPIRMWLAEPLPDDVRHAIYGLMRIPDLRYIAVLPDVHLAEDVCVGVALATAEYVYPAAVGGDIGCGMLAVALDADAAWLDRPEAAARLLAALYDVVPANKHRSLQQLPHELLAVELSDTRLERVKRRDGSVQFGTLGRGNHFVEFQRDAEQRLWLMIHSGSRGTGQAITNHHRQRCERQSGLPGLPADEPRGRAYLHDAGWARRYASENRLQMARAIAALVAEEAVSADWSTLIHCDHNHVAREEHFGQSWWVHRKGAMPADMDQPGLIPGSMGTCSFQVAGRGCAESLRTCSHGAGRKLSRSAARQLSDRDVLRAMHDVWFDRRMLAALREEAPGAYKDVRAVLRAQRELTRIVRELRPVLVYKGTS